MKYFLGFMSIICLVCLFIFCPSNQTQKVEYLRIHIRANSNSIEDQTVKYLVKDAVVDALIPLLSEAKNFQEAKKCIENNFSLIENVADDILEKYGFQYSSNAQIKRELFPARVYENITLAEGEYDALILNLGEGEGNNWWCLVYPAFCFTSSTNSDNVVYISKILEIIKNITREE